MMATKTDRPKVLIEQWLPIAEIGAECMRKRGASSALPPLYFLHVWWARRPLTVSRAAILASLLPAYPTDGDDDIRTWPPKFIKRFPTFDAYKQWFLKLIGIQGNPAASRKIIDWAKTQGIKLTPAIIARLPAMWREGLPGDMGVSIPYGYPRAFTYNPSSKRCTNCSSGHGEPARSRSAIRCPAAAAYPSRHFGSDWPSTLMN
jgi:hypothetical protein